MRTIDFTLLAVLIGSYIAMVGAIPVGDGSPAGSIARRDEEYVPLQQQLHGEHGCSDSTKKNPSIARPAAIIVTVAAGPAMAQSESPDCNVFCHFPSIAELSIST